MSTNAVKEVATNLAVNLVTGATYEYQPANNKIVVKPDGNNVAPDSECVAPDNTTFNAIKASGGTVNLIQRDQSDANSALDIVQNGGKIEKTADGMTLHIPGKPSVNLPDGGAFSALVAAKDN